MPWFRKSKRKHKISKKDISEPTEFKHCYHAILDANSRELEGLPPQWSELVETQCDKKLLTISSLHRPDTPHQQPDFALEKDGPVKDTDVFTPSDRFVGELYNINQSGENTKLNTESLNSSVSKDRAGSPQGTCVSLKEYNARNLCSSTKSSFGSTNSTLSLTKRPSPIVRDSDASIEDTIRCIRKQSQHRSDENVQEESSNRTTAAAGGDKDGVMSRPRSHGRSRTGSFMQLRSSPIVRKHVVSYTSGTTSVTPHPSDRLPPSNFCLSAPSEVIQSDLGLYDGSSSEVESDFYQCRINSPNGSSGYFGSSASSLYSSRISSTQQLTYSSQHSQPHALPHNMPALPSSPRDGEHHHDFVSSSSSTHSNHPTYSSSSSSHSSHHHHHRFNSLQRRLDFSNSGSGMGHHHHQMYGNSNSQGSAGAVRSGYGTAPRMHRPHLNAQSVLQYPEMDRIHESSCGKVSQQEKSYAHNYPLTTSSSKTSELSAPPLSPNDSLLWNGGRRDVLRHHRSSSAGNYDRFRATLELLVNPGDPRGKYVDFRKIGEGSTGHVYTARDVLTGEIVAIKKMNLWKQQRRELLFNEVIKLALFCVI